MTQQEGRGAEEQGKLATDKTTKGWGQTIYSMVTMAAVAAAVAVDSRVVCRGAAPEDRIGLGGMGVMGYEDKTR
jgi:hypothetical protein